MKSLDIFKISLREVLLYTSGTYQALFEVRCKQRRIPFNVKPEEQFQKTTNESYMLQAWHQDGEQTEAAQLRGRELDIAIDRSVFIDPVYLHVTVLKHDPDKASTSYADAFFKYATGKLLLKPKKILFPLTPLDEDIHKGSIKLFTLLDNEQICVATGFMKFLMENEKIEDLEARGDSQEETIDVNAATDATTALVDDLKKATADTSTLQVVGGSDDISVKDVDVLMQTRISSTSSDAKSFTIDFPAVDAIKLILPKFHALTEETSTETPVKAHVPIHEPQKAMSSQVATRDSLLPVELSERGNLDSHVIAVLDYQTKELDRYRNVIQTMGQDVIELRRKILKLQHEKSQLATKLYYAGDGVVSENGDDLEVIVPLKRRLAAENEEKNTLQERVYKLQNEIIKKNDIEASYLQLQEAHEIQQERMQQLQSKLSKYKLLQSTCQSQEKVIEELEKRLASTADNKSLPSKSKGTRKSNLKSVAYEKENNALRVFQIDEKLRLIEKLEQAEGTITALEEQLHINAKHWARDRALAQESSAIQRRLVPMPSGYMAATYNRRHAENDRPYLPRYTHNRFQNNPFGR
ncbi:uncharacterized protein LOC130649294 isoform X2 [Hydractinia symbiolongicarpus]|uniref:uncharacterized protein LOC130649294 isoform X2 n=1 Tax=Hydractinia symbiolongicarpus TaxID=13093 RepID=UPI00255000C4|nr:uncharacterized protein LOC130649294 isoform X2 [Hydractinia symbiolongicarpus]